MTPLAQKTAEALRQHIEELEETVRQLREQIVPDVTFPREIGLTRMENAVLSFLLARSPNVVSRDRITHAIYFDKDDAPGSAIVSVMLVKLRRKLAPYGVKIMTQWGSGFAIDHAGASILKAMLEGKIRRVAAPEDRL
jgi:two-component system, cell cycle response regulator CtrA